MGRGGRTGVLAAVSAGLRTLNQMANRHAGKLLLFGLAGVVWYNWRQWQRDTLHQCDVFTFHNGIILP